MNNASRNRSAVVVPLAALAIAVFATMGPVACTTSPDGPSPNIRGSAPTDDQMVRIDDANAAKGAGDYDTAMSLFQGILAENPTITTAYLGIGDIYLLQEDYESAEPAFGRAARLEPRSYDAQFGHGLALQMLDRFVDAIRAYRRALDINPKSASANLSVATSYLQLNEAGRAVEYAQRAVDLDPENGPARANLGAIYEELGMYDRAIDTYIAALELMGNHPPLMINLINSLAEERRYREAVNTAQNLVRIAPSANAFERLGWCHFKLREFNDSLDAYREAVTLDPDHWPSLNGVGVNSLNNWLASKRLDDEARLEARDSFRRSLRINPRQQRVIDLMLNYNL